MGVQVKEHASRAQPRVRQAKILRDPERIDPADGLPRSRGLGFVEFSEHEHAICALRHLNNNPAPFSKDAYPHAWPHHHLFHDCGVRKCSDISTWCLLVISCNHAREHGCYAMIHGMYGSYIMELVQVACSAA